MTTHHPTQLTVVSEHRFYRGPDGQIVASDGLFGPRFWTRYTRQFDRVEVVARVSETVLPAGTPVESDSVRFRPLPDFNGGVGLIKARLTLRSRLSRLLPREGCFLVRTPGLIGSVATSILTSRGQPYGAEVIGDPAEAFGPVACRHRLQPLLCVAATRTTRRVCRNASTIAYVTAKRLQTRYPAAVATPSFAYSSIDLPAGALVRQPRAADSFTPPIRAIVVANMAAGYKGHSYLIDGVAEARRRGVDLTLTIIGEGRLRGELEAQAARLGMTETVAFAGRVDSGRPVWERLRSHDLFVLPSLTEGLPRALIEAMASGLPAIGARVGGIPELLPESDLFDAASGSAIADAIERVAGQPTRLAAMSARNLAAAADYRSDVLTERRDRMYQALKARTYGAGPVALRLPAGSDRQTGSQAVSRAESPATTRRAA